jgi:hypothetical protein
LKFFETETPILIFSPALSVLEWYTSRKGYFETDLPSVNNNPMLILLLSFLVFDKWNSF